MSRLAFVAFLIVVAATGAHAQPRDAPAPQPNGLDEPSTVGLPPAPSADAPPQPLEPRVPVQAPQQPPQQPQAFYDPSGLPPSTFRNGITGEISLGYGYRIFDAGGDVGDPEGGLGFGASIGFFLNPNFALLARSVGVVESSDYEAADGTTSTTYLTNAFIGPTVQAWLNDQVWLGGGLGLARFRISSSNEAANDLLGDLFNFTGFGLDARAGYTFHASSEHTFNVSFEMTAGFFDEELFDGRFNSYNFIVLVGYQHL